MILRNLKLGVLIFIVIPVFGQENRYKEILKPRIVVLTDVSTWETDDSESLIRLLVHADLFEIEGIIYTTGWSHEVLRDDFINLIHDAIDAYEKDLPNLKKRSNQVAFNKDETRQIIGYWPSPDYLRQHTVFGSKQRGIDKIGINNISDGSNLIINLANEKDKRPLWILLWGGGNTLAQSIWQVQQNSSEDELKAFLHKIPTYAITDQDRSYKGGTPFQISSHQWMRKEFEKDLKFLWDECAWKYQNGNGKRNWDEYAQHVQNHGNLGKLYPKYKYGVEGDTPSFLYLMPNGLNDPLVPNQVSWGGYFEWGISPDDSTFAYNNHKGKAKQICNNYASYFYSATFNNFAARMDWASEGKGNRNPIIALNGNVGIDLVHIEKKVEETIVLDASKSLDPENDPLAFKWWVMSAAGTYSGKVAIENKKLDKILIDLPSDSAGKTIHIICEVTDKGMPSLTSYRRIIITPK
ncbi:DUF1593 domain-containing protein [Cyclobacterium marinum]|uniref:DUF1593 domain-containing protein n=1 Tax=Cyclobacterium marinum TaxID=104 RepID=UPI0011EEA888|nr:DUF1593 domain-containing protein [Cyclobacterium marinum]MBI0400658.1 DUF1593 domain-containing protein [Cyclobacterium marinum]